MDSSKTKCTTIDEYIAMFPPETAAILEQIREVIKEAVPEATEKISYQMPTFYLNGNLVYFAAFKKHIGFFPTASGVAQFADRLTDYKTSKGTIQLPLNKPIPYDFIREIVRFRVSENNHETVKVMTTPLRICQRIIQGNSDKQNNHIFNNEGKEVRLCPIQ